MKDIETSHQQLKDRLESGEPVTELLGQVVPYLRDSQHKRVLKKAMRYQHEPALRELATYSLPEDDMGETLASWVDSWLSYEKEALDFIAEKPELFHPFIGDEPDDAWEKLYVELRYGDASDKRFERFLKAFRALYDDSDVAPDSVDALREAIKNDNPELVQALLDDGKEATLTHLVEALDREDAESARLVLNELSLNELTEKRRAELLETLLSVSEETVRVINDSLPSDMVRQAIARSLRNVSYSSGRYTDRVKALLPALDREGYRELKTPLYDNRDARGVGPDFLQFGDERGWLDDETLAEFLIEAMEGGRADRVKVLYDHGASLKLLIDSGLDEDERQALRDGAGGSVRVVDLILCREPESVCQAVLHDLFEANMAKRGGNKRTVKLLMKRHDYQPPDMKQLLCEAVAESYSYDALQYVIDHYDGSITQDMVNAAYNRLTDQRRPDKRAILFLLNNELYPKGEGWFYDQFIDKLNKGDPFDEKGIEFISELYSYELFPAEDYMEKLFSSSSDVDKKRGRVLFEQLPPRHQKYLQTAGIEPLMDDEIEQIDPADA